MADPQHTTAPERRYNLPAVVFLFAVHGIFWFVAGIVTAVVLIR